jgi:Effector Associated Constant Component 1
VPPSGRGHQDERVQSQFVSDSLLSIGADDGDVLRSLLDWLRHEDALRGRVRAAQTPVRPGEMGGVLDVLEVALGSGGAGAVLATSVSAWLSQPRRADVTLTVTAEDGRHIELDARRVRDPAVLLREVRWLLKTEG